MLVTLMRQKVNYRGIQRDMYGNKKTWDKMFISRAWKGTMVDAIDSIVTNCLFSLLIFKCAKCFLPDYCLLRYQSSLECLKIVKSNKPQK